MNAYMREGAVREESRARRASPSLNMASRMDRALRGWGIKRRGLKEITHRKEDRERPREWWPNGRAK